MLKLIKNARIYAPASLGMRDLVIGGGKILAMDGKIDLYASVAEVWDAEGKIATPGLIDQHVHLIGAGGKHGFASMTPEIMIGDFIACGSTTVVGMLGTDATARSIKTLYAKTKALDLEGITAYMHTSYFGIDPITLTGRIQDDLIFIDKVLGCKLAISDERSSYPEPLEILRHLREVHVGGLISGKGGILHVHLGGLSTRMDILFEMVQKHEFPIRHISPTHVGRSKVLFDQALEFAKLGGMIDITTGATKYTDPWRCILYALDQGVDLSRLTFSTDGHAGLGVKDHEGCECGFTKAPVSKNLEEFQGLVKQGGLPLQDAVRVVTCNPAHNLSLRQKGKIDVGADADLCFFDEDLNLKEVMAMGKILMKDGTVVVKGAFEK